jgi:hypothetical protein
VPVPPNFDNDWTKPSAVFRKISQLRGTLVPSEGDLGWLYQETMVCVLTPIFVQWLRGILNKLDKSTDLVVGHNVIQQYTVRESTILKLSPFLPAC